MNGKLPILAMLLLFAAPVQAEDYREAVRKGNTAYTDQNYKEALEQYQIAETEIPESPQLDYNIAGVLYHEGKYEEAVDRFTKASASDEAALSAQAHYNLGNTYFRMGDYQNAIASYEESLKLEPTDMDAKYNLELARRMLKNQMQPQEDNQDQEQQQQQQQEQEQEQQQQQQENQQQQQQQQQEQQQQQPDEQQSKQERIQEQREQMSKEDAERILNALRDDERDIQKKIRRDVTGSNYQGKDW